MVNIDNNVIIIFVVCFLPFPSPDACPAALLRLQKKLNDPGACNTAPINQEALPHSFNYTDLAAVVRAEAGLPIARSDSSASGARVIATHGRKSISSKTKVLLCKRL